MNNYHCVSRRDLNMIPPPCTLAWQDHRIPLPHFEDWCVCPWSAHAVDTNIIIVNYAALCAFWRIGQCSHLGVCPTDLTPLTSGYFQLP